MMEKLNFTARVLGQRAASRLEAYQVTQTLRSDSSSIGQAYFHSQLTPGDLMQVILDDRMIGLVELTIADRVTWGQLDQDDARRGGFDNRFELAYALKRAGYRFKSLDKYEFWRFQFSWVDSDGVPIDLEARADARDRQLDEAKEV